jgi:hypothetical protein
MTNLVSFVLGSGNGRTFCSTSTTSGLFSGTRTAWLEEAMMRISFRQKNSTHFASRKLVCRDYLISLSCQASKFDFSVVHAHPRPEVPFGPLSRQAPRLKGFGDRSSAQSLQST